MKRIFIYVAIGLGALASGAFIAKLQAQLRPTANSAPAPTIPAPTATPEVIPVNTPTRVIVTVSVSDSRVIPTGVNLLRVNAMGSPTNQGRMYDDATHGDALAGDGTFTALMTLNETHTGNVQLQVSVALKGLLRRVLSSVFIVEVWKEIDEQFGVTFLYPPDWTVTNLNDIPDATGVYIADAAEEFSGEGITIVMVGGLPEVLADLNSRWSLTHRSILNVNGMDWTKLIHNDSLSGLEFVTFVYENNGHALSIGCRNVETTVRIAEAILNTVTF